MTIRDSNIVRIININLYYRLNECSITVKLIRFHVDESEKEVLHKLIYLKKLILRKIQINTITHFTGMFI